MNNQKQTRCVSSERVRGFFSEIADAICEANSKVTFALSGNTFEIRLEGGSINITINEEGGAV